MTSKKLDEEFQRTIDSTLDAQRVTLVAPLESNGGIPVNIQDQTSIPVDFFFTQIKGPPTTVAVATAIDDRTVTVTSAAGCAVGDYFGMFNADDVNNNRSYFGTIQSIAGNVLTLDTPIDFAFQVGNTAACFTREMNVDGSVTPQYFSVQIGSAATQSVDITRIMISMITDTAPNLVLFGDLLSLTNGLVLRRVDGTMHNIWNVKNNGEIANLCFDYDPSLATNPAQGQNGAKFRYTFAGQDKHGVAIRLEPGDRLEAIIQDSLLGLLQFRIIAEGHYVTD
jgi:hypothetical protein